MESRVRRLLVFVSPLALLAAGAAQAGETAEAADAVDASAYLEAVTVHPEQLKVDLGKVDAAISDIPQSISVVSNAQFLERGAQNLQETLRYTAGVVAEAYGNDGRNDNSFVRGVEAPIYLDGLRQTFGYYSPRTDIHMLEQVEVLKGPGGSLYGAGTIGGLINQTSKRPQFVRSGEVSVAYGTHDRYEATADVTGPLDRGGAVAARLVAVLRESGTQTDYVRDDRFLLAPSLTWAPDERTTLTLLGRYQKDKGGTISTFVPIAASLGAAPGRRLPTSRFLSEPGWEKYDTETFAVSLLAQHRLNDAVTLRSNTRFLDADVDYQSIYPDSYSNPDQPFIDTERRVLNRTLWAMYPHIRNFTTDNHLQAEFATLSIRHTLLAGVDYQKYSDKSEFISGSAPPIDAYAPVYGNYAIPSRSPNPTDRLSQLGFYVQDQIRVDRVSVLLGVRRDRAKGEADGSASQLDKATTYRAAAMVDLPRGVTPYVSYSESFQPVTGATFSGEAFRPTRGRQWEVGVKWQVASDSLFTLAAYKITERNRLTRDPANPFFSIQTGEAQLKGLEAEATTRLAGVDLTGALTFAETEITESNNPGEIGRALETAPETQASLFAARTFPISDDVSVRLGAGVRYVGESYSGDVRTPGYTVGDAFAALGWRDWLLSVNATNLTDKRYYSTCLVRGDCFLGVRRTVTATVRRRF